MGGRSTIKRVLIEDVPEENLRDIIRDILDELHMVPVACEKAEGIAWWGAKLASDPNIEDD